MSWKVVWIVSALLISVVLIVEFNALLVLFRALWIRLAWVGRWGWVFGRRLALSMARRLMLRQVMKPVLTLLGVTWLTRFVSRHFGAYVAPRARYVWLQSRRHWHHTPWFVKGGVLIGGLAVALLLGVGLWLIPFGIPYAGTAAAKLQLALADSWIMSRTRAIRARFHRWMRARRGHVLIRPIRGFRYWIIRRHRLWDRRAARALAAITHR